MKRKLKKKTKIKKFENIPRVHLRIEYIIVITGYVIRMLSVYLYTYISRYSAHKY